MEQHTDEQLPELIDPVAVLEVPGPGIHMEVARWLMTPAAERGIMRLSTKFTVSDVLSMGALLGENRQVPPGGPTRLKDHVEHCFWQMARFANLASLGKGFREGQFCLNLGRVQELLGSHGGVEAWWRTFEPLVQRGDWTEIRATAERYLKLLGLGLPTAEFVNRE